MFWQGNPVKMSFHRSGSRQFISSFKGIENPRVLGSIPSPGTNIHKASLQSGAFSFLGYGRFLVVATRYLFAGFLAIFADVRYF
ncbi:hypothetical protein NMD36_20455 [Escherichia coli]